MIPEILSNTTRVTTRVSSIYSKLLIHSFCIISLLQFPKTATELSQQTAKQNKLRADSHIACHAVNSHMPCRTPAMFRQCRVLRVSPRGSRKYPNCQSNSLTDRLFCSVLLPLFTIAGMNRCEKDWYASDNNLRGTPRGGRKKPIAGRQPTGRLSTAVLCRGLEKNGMIRNGMGMAWQA